MSSWGPENGALAGIWPPPPTFVEEDIPDLTGKTIVVTGAASGIGLAYSKCVYAKNASVWVLGRSAEAGNKALEEIRASAPNSSGEVRFQFIDLSDLDTIVVAARELLSKLTRLDVLVNNAGTLAPLSAGRTKQGHQIQWGTNVLGHYLLTKLLTPLLMQTAKTSPANSVRLLWITSHAITLSAPPNGGIHWEDLDFEQTKDGPLAATTYGQSKAGDFFLAVEFARRYKDSGVISLSIHPGGVSTDLFRTYPRFLSWFLGKTVLWPPVYAAYTILFASFSPEVTAERNGKFVAAWGRFTSVRKDLIESVALGDDGNSYKVWEWCEKAVQGYNL